MLAISDSHNSYNSVNFMYYLLSVILQFVYDYYNNLANSQLKCLAQYERNCLAPPS